MSRDTIVELLLQHGAEVNMVSDSGRTALSYACEHRCNDIVDILVKHASVDPDIPDSEGRAHPPHPRGHPHRPRGAPHRPRGAPPQTQRGILQ